MKEVWKHYNLARIWWLMRHGSIYFPFWNMVFKYPPLLAFNAVLMLKSNLSNSCIVHTIGDSHVVPFTYRFPYLIHHISQATAHNLGKEKSFTRSSEYLNLFLSKINKKRDVVMLVFGEIDARVHIYLKYGKSGRTRSIDSLVDETVEKYGEAIGRIKKDGFAVCVHGIPPAASKEFITALPFAGKPRERSEISRKFNLKLKERCEALGVPYIDIQSIASDDNGFIKKYYLADEVHCNSRIVPFTSSVIKEAFKKEKRFL
ncbi:MAG: SGNH/GDSL hydrolase family protein [Dehalococcoidia bacterium]|jgi:lysophospholipase L1-like esterase